MSSSQFIEALLSQSLAGIEHGKVEIAFGDRFRAVAPGASGGRLQNVDRIASVPVRFPSDESQLIVVDRVGGQPPLRPIFENPEQFLVGIRIERDHHAGADARLQALVERVVDGRLTVGDHHHRHFGNRIEFLQEAFVFELIELIEDDDVGRLDRFEPSEHFVVGRRAVDVVGVFDPFEDFQQRSKSVGMLPAVDVMSLDTEQLFVESVKRVAGKTGFTCIRGSNEKGILWRIVVNDGLEGGSKPIHLIMSIGRSRGG